MNKYTCTTQDFVLSTVLTPHIFSDSVGDEVRKTENTVEDGLGERRRRLWEHSSKNCLWTIAEDRRGGVLKTRLPCWLMGRPKQGRGHNLKWQVSVSPLWMDGSSANHERNPGEEAVWKERYSV